MLHRDGLKAGTDQTYISKADQPAADQASKLMGGRQVFAAAFSSNLASSMRAPD